MKRIRASALCVLLTAGAASAADGVRLVAQPDIVPGVAAFPRVAPLVAYGRQFRPDAAFHKPVEPAPLPAVRIRATFEGWGR
jgi:hypothetical protein